MTINYFLLCGGLLSLLFSFGHAAWGQKNIMGEVAATEMPALVKHAIFTNWHQTTSFMLISGIVLIVASVLSDTARAKSIAWLVVAITLGNFLVFVTASVVKNRQAFRQTVPQLAIMVAYLSIVVVGITTT